MLVIGKIKRYQYDVAGVNVGTRQVARELQRAMRQAGSEKKDTKIIQRMLIEKVIR